MSKGKEHARVEKNWYFLPCAVAALITTVLISILSLVGHFGAVTGRVNNIGWSFLAVLPITIIAAIVIEVVYHHQKKNSDVNQQTLNEKFITDDIGLTKANAQVVDDDAVKEYIDELTKEDILLKKQGGDPPLKNNDKNSKKLK